MISPWTIYWIMQLDSIRGIFTGSLFVGLVGGVVCLVFSPFLIDDDFGLPRSISKKIVIAVASVLVIGALGSAFIPNSKTVAAMVLIPAIANNETVQKEAGELYQLAKDGLKELVKPEEPKK